jgi:5-methyltetrahydropteroyltriglutamate--homocysteine methyltransferase
MKRSTDRILTTHVGSLSRPDALVQVLTAKERGQPYDREAYIRLVPEAVADVVRRQTDAGVDIVTDGEQSKASFFGYIVERFHGLRPPSGPTRAGRQHARGEPRVPGLPRVLCMVRPHRGGARGTRQHPPVRHRRLHGARGLPGSGRRAGGHRDTEGRAAGRPHEEVFLPAIAPSNIFATLPNRFYRTDEEYEQALADALHEEYRAIVDAGFVLQVDDPRLVTHYMMNPGASVADCRAWAARRVEAINHALRDIPPERVRFRTCYSIDVGPRVHDMELKDIVDVLFKIKAGAFSFEAANPRHEHEYHVFVQFKPPAGMILIPGVISHTTNLVEHPELIAERIVRFARIVGRENVIAGADCGFAASGTRFNDVHPTAVWLKFAALAEGARLATRKLWA